MTHRNVGRRTATHGGPYQPDLMPLLQRHNPVRFALPKLYGKATLSGLYILSPLGRR